jgi:hypothetical protein
LSSRLLRSERFVVDTDDMAYVFVAVALVGSLLWLWIALAYTSAPVQD